MDQTHDRFVVVHLRGGLGNQLFQYALGATIARKHNRRLVLDDLALRTVPPTVTPREYHLGEFPIDAAVTSMARFPAGSLLARVTQERRGFHREVLEPCAFPTLYLQGFWQDYRYFAESADVVRTALSPDREWCDARWARTIRGTSNAVALHVRRQDYLVKDKLGFIGKAYYEQAVRALLAAVREPHFFIVSDDLDWCERHLDIPHPHAFVRHDTAGDHTVTDFRLMSLCRHFVIANSTFSWWAAWLGAAPDKRVIAPLRWFADRDEDSRDIVPAAWTRV